MVDGSQVQERCGLALLIFSHIIVCCVSLVFVANYRYAYAFSPPSFHVFYDPDRLYIAVTLVAAITLVSIVFLIARFSFGYFVSFYFYTMIVGYLWIECFTDLNYNHRLSAFSAAVSIVAFMLPALFVSSPVRQMFALSAESFDRLLILIFALGAATAALGAFYNFRIVTIENIYEYREKLDTPILVNYLQTIVSSTLLPFAFAGFVARKSNWHAVAILILLLLFYPITLTKITLFAPIWLVVMLLLSRLFPARTAVVISLFIPTLMGLVLLALFKLDGASYFVVVNFRMITIPSVAMDVYNDFFSKHQLTHFCHISLLRPILDCPYQEQLSLVLRKAYELGNFNGSLFVTEGLASVGPLLAPFTAFACGLVIALGNRLSANLPASFVLISSAILPQVLLNVPLSVAMLTHGMGLLFLLWYITPRSIFEHSDPTDD